MSDAVARPRQPVDIDEFERRLRGPEPGRTQSEDPLAELARLVQGAHEPAPAVAVPQFEPRQPSALVADQRQPQPVYDPSVGIPGVDAQFTIGNPRYDVIGDASLAHLPTADDLAQLTDPRAQSEWRPGFEDARVAEAPRKSRKSVYTVGAAMAVVVVGIGATFALKSGPVGSKEAPLIRAAVGPTKVQPEASAVASVVQTASVLDKGGDKLNGSRVVNTQEQPVDSAATRSARPQNGAPAAPREAGSSIFPEPKRVKTVSVRPDGSIVGADIPVATTPPAGGAQRAPVAALAASPSAARAAPATPAAAAAKPAQRVAARVQDDDDAAPAPKTVVAKPTPKPVAKVEEAKPSSAKGFAVQLASAGSDAEARNKAARVKQQQAGMLGGRNVTVVKGEANGKPVWRVRVVGLTHEDASAMCGKVKGGGGECFVAR